MKRLAGGFSGSLKNAFRTDLVNVTVLNTFATVIKMLTGLISVKVVASFIGPSGVALLGQLNNFASVLLTLSNGGINAGITKFIAEHRSDKKTINGFVATGLVITFLLSSVISLILLLGSRYLSDIILHDTKYWLVFVLFGVTIFFYSLNALFISVINGLKEFRKYVSVNIIGSVVGLVFSIVLVWSYGTYGALLAAVSFQSVVFIVTCYFIFKMELVDFRRIFGFAEWDKVIRLVGFSLMALTSALTVPTAQMFIRNAIIEVHGINDAGIWEGMNRISSMYLMVVTTSLGVYLLPKLSSLRSDIEIRTELFRVFRFILPFLVFSALIIYMFREQIIHLLYTNDFLTMESLFAYQLVGDFLKICGWVFGYLLLARAMTRMYVFLELMNFAGFILVAEYFVASMGAKGATVGYAVVYLLYLGVLIVYFRKILFLKPN
jgi:PST family polysaccharide transporter